MFLLNRTPPFSAAPNAVVLAPCYVPTTGTSIEWKIQVSLTKISIALIHVVIVSRVSFTVVLPVSLQNPSPFGGTETLVEREIPKLLAGNQQKTAPNLLIERKTCAFMEITLLLCHPSRRLPYHVLSTMFISCPAKFQVSAIKWATTSHMEKLIHPVLTWAATCLRKLIHPVFTLAVGISRSIT